MNSLTFKFRLFTNRSFIFFLKSRFSPRLRLRKVQLFLLHLGSIIIGKVIPYSFLLFCSILSFLNPRRSCPFFCLLKVFRVASRWKVPVCKQTAMTTSGARILPCIFFEDDFLLQKKINSMPTTSPNQDVLYPTKVFQQLKLLFQHNIESVKELI